MTGDVVIGVGLAVLGIGAPLTVAVAKYFANGKRLVATMPGHSEECRKHRETMVDLQQQVCSLSDNVQFIRESVRRIEVEVQHVQDKMK
jgi:hypothetical protein